MLRTAQRSWLCGELGCCVHENDKKKSGVVSWNITWGFAHYHVCVNSDSLCILAWELLTWVNNTQESICSSLYCINLFMWGSRNRRQFDKKCYLAHGQNMQFFALYQQKWPCQILAKNFLTYGRTFCCLTLHLAATCCNYITTFIVGVVFCLRPIILFNKQILFRIL